MATIDFLKFAYGTSANKLSQALYVAAGWVASGFPTSGTDKTAYSQSLNKVWSQSSFMANLIASFMSAQTNTDVLDDGNTSGKLTQLAQAIASLSNGMRTAVAAAATTDLGSPASGGQLSNNRTITGTNTAITSLGSSASTSAPYYFVTFAGAGNSFTNSASLACLSGANMAFAAGDSALVEYLGGGNWRVVSYWPASPAAVPALKSAYREWVLFDNTGAILAQFSSRAGVTFAVAVNSTAPGGGGCDYTITPSTAFPTSNFAATPVGQGNSVAHYNGLGIYSKSTSSISIGNFDTSNGNPTSSTSVFVGFNY